MTLEKAVERQTSTSSATNRWQPDDASTKSKYDDRDSYERKVSANDKTDSSKDTSGSISPNLSDNEDENDESLFVVTFSEQDKSDPFQWSKTKKCFVVGTGMLMVLNSTMGSALPSGAVGSIQKYFDIKNDELLVLPVSIYLIGYILGPMVFAPLSETYGRKVVMICTFTMFTLFILACALAHSFASLIVFRLLVGIGASTPVSVIGGIYADIYKTKKARGFAMALFMAGTTWGPLSAPVISGYVSVPIGWRWVFWIELIVAGATWPFLLLLPETYGPVLLKRKAKKLRKETGNKRYVAYSEQEKLDLWTICTNVLMRPIRMFLFEAIVLCSCLYLSFEYGIFYMFFQAFDPIFGDVYGFTPGEVGLCFIPIGIGSMIATGVYLWWDWFLERAQNRPNPPAWCQKEEYSRLPLACFGGPLIVVGLFWIGWTARPSIPWIVPVLGALPFGTGFLMIFMSLINYIVDAYEIYAASAMGAASASRSVFGVILPFAARPMYAKLGIAWSCTLLAILSAVMCLVPFVFIRYGEKIRENSNFCKELKQKKEENEQRQEKLWEQQRRASQRSQDLEKQI